MKFLLDILIIAANTDETEIAELPLSRAGIGGNFIRVETKQEFIKQIHRKKYDVILVNHTSSDLNYTDAFRICKSEHITTPFVLITDELLQIENEKINQSNSVDVINKNQLSLLPAVVMNAVTNARLLQDARSLKQDMSSFLPNREIKQYYTRNFY